MEYSFLSECEAKIKGTLHVNVGVNSQVCMYVHVCVHMCAYVHVCVCV